MKRDAALVSLSRDHHQALAVAQKLRRATAETADEARSALLAYWRQHGRVHFRLEEEVLLPAYAGYGDGHHPLVARALCDHVVIRHRIERINDRPAPDPAELQRLGAELSEHVRFEERQLFGEIEQAMPVAELEMLARALERAEHGCADR